MKATTLALTLSEGIASFLSSTEGNDTMSIAPTHMMQDELDS